MHADTIYRTRANRHYCKAGGIHLSGKPLGRPKKATSENQHELKAEKARQRQDELDCIPVEGKFGNAKRKGTLRHASKVAYEVPVGKKQLWGDGLWSDGSFINILSPQEG